MASPIEGTGVYSRACALGSRIWRLALNWPGFAKDNLGGQLVRSTDSIASNLVEGDGRGSDKDAARFFVIARASAREARHWLVTASERGLLSAEECRSLVDELTEIVKMINGLIAFRRKSFVKEPLATYDLDFAEDDLADPFKA